MALLEGREYYLSKKIGKAMVDYAMLSPGDKIAVAVSGGKDSLTLLYFLNARNKFVPIRHELLAVHVDLGYPHSYRKALERYFQKLKVRYRVVSTDALNKTPHKEINCFWCSWNRRKVLFETAAKFGCNKVALGHHKDDIVQTILLNLFFQGEISAMCPKQELFQGRLTVIRPLAYIEEREIGSFAKEKNFPSFCARCPQAENSQRRKIAEMLKDLKRVCPDITTNIFRSVKRIRSEYLL